MQLPLVRPVGIGYHPGSASLIVSAHFREAGGSMVNEAAFVAVNNAGALSQYSSATIDDNYFHNEVKLEIIQAAVGGFAVGELYSGNGKPGEIAKISSDGSNVIHSWATLRYLDNNEWKTDPGLLRGGLHHDRTGLFGGDLIAVTDQGGVYRVAANGSSTFVMRVFDGSVPAHLEGVTVLPNDSYYGSWAGKILTGVSPGSPEPQQSGMWLINPSANPPTANNVGVALSVDAEDLDIVPSTGSHNFYTVNLLEDDGKYFNDLYKVPASYFATRQKHIVATVEEGAGGAKLVGIQFSGGNPTTYEIGSIATTAGHFEHSTFAPASIDIPVQKPSVGIATIAPFVTEGESAICFEVWRVGNVDNALTITCALGGSATHTLDYGLAQTTDLFFEVWSSLQPTGSPGQFTLTFDAGLSVVRVAVAAVADGANDDPSESLSVTLASQTHHNILAGQGVASVNIVQPGQSPILAILATRPETIEGGGPKEHFKLIRAGGTQALNTVAFTASGSAMLGADYTLNPTSPTALGSDELEQGLLLTPTSDFLTEEGVEVATLTLAVGSGYTIGANASASVRIHDAPAVTLQVLGATAHEDGSTSGSIKVTRSGSLAAPLNVGYSVGGTAGEGDYTITPTFNNAVIFRAGQADAYLNVRAHHNSGGRGEMYGETLTFELLAHAVGEFYVLGNPFQGEITIIDLPEPPPSFYVITSLGVTQSPSDSAAYGVSLNSSSQVYVVGDFRQSTYYQRAFRWLNGNLTGLGIIGYGNGYSYAFDVNSSGVTVGYGNYYGGSYNYPIRWAANGALQSLNKLNYAHYQADAALAINDAGNAVGVCYNGSGKWRAVRWNATGISVADLNTLAGPAPNLSSYAYDINQAGRVVGKSDSIAGPMHAFLTLPIQSIRLDDDLGTMHPGGVGASEAYAVNDFDEVVGACISTSGEKQAFFKLTGTGKDAGFVPLGFLAQGAMSAAFDISNAGHIVGSSRTAGLANPRAFISYAGETTLISLQSKVTNLGSWFLHSAEGIDDLGHIVGWGYVGGVRTAYLLTPQ